LKRLKSRFKSRKAIWAGSDAGQLVEINEGELNLLEASGIRYHAMLSKREKESKISQQHKASPTEHPPFSLFSIAK
jgi:hypothetical protein